MTTVVNITDAELSVVQVLWNAGPLSADEVATALQGEQDWGFATVKTLLSRLMKKGAITAEVEGRRFIYAAAVSRQDYLQSASTRIVERLYDGSVAALVSHFSEARGLSEQDIAAMRALLDQLE